MLSILHYKLYFWRYEASKMGRDFSDTFYNQILKILQPWWMSIYAKNPTHTSMVRQCIQHKGKVRSKKKKKSKLGGDTSSASRGASLFFIAVGPDSYTLLWVGHWSTAQLICYFLSPARYPFSSPGWRRANESKVPCPSKKKKINKCRVSYSAFPVLIKALSCI